MKLAICACTQAARQKMNPNQPWIGTHCLASLLSSSSKLALLSLVMTIIFQSSPIFHLQLMTLSGIYDGAPLTFI